MGSRNAIWRIWPGHETRAALLIVVAALLLLPQSAFADTFNGRGGTDGRNGPIAVVDAGGDSSAMTLGLLTGGEVHQLFTTRLDDIYISHPSFSPDGNWIVFSEGAGSPRTSLGLAAVTGGRPRGIGTGPISARNPTFLASGRIVFSGSTYPSGRHPGTFVVDANGSHRRRLFAREQLAASADGKWFVATDRRGNFHTLHLLDRRGRQVRRLSADPTYRYLNPRFSPDGKWIAYERENEHRGQLPHYSNIYVVKRDGTHRRRLTFDRNSAAPAFSPDGRWIAFTRANNGLGGNLFAVSVEHPSRRRLLTPSGGTACREPAWGRRH